MELFFLTVVVESPAIHNMQLCRGASCVGEGVVCCCCCYSLIAVIIFAWCVIINQNSHEFSVWRTFCNSVKVGVTVVVAVDAACWACHLLCYVGWSFSVLLRGPDGELLLLRLAECCMLLCCLQRTVSSVATYLNNFFLVITRFVIQELII